MGIQVDGKELDAPSYTAESGSVVIHLKPAFLHSLVDAELVKKHRA